MYLRKKLSMVYSYNGSTWFYIYSEPHHLRPRSLVNLSKNIILQTSTKVQGKAKERTKWLQTSWKSMFTIRFDPDEYFLPSSLLAIFVLYAQKALKNCDKFLKKKLRKNYSWREILYQKMFHPQNNSKKISKKFWIFSVEIFHMMIRFDFTPKTQSWKRR